MKTIELIKKIIVENIDNSIIIENNTNLKKDFNLDSFDVLMIMNAIDDEFSISLEDDDFQEINTPEEIVSLLQTKYGVL
ncbi:MAG: acyl carrier protein [Candidatus Cloacimonetes bacterium]|nr:acyl carrier protein [Candidatus Cloacimonadota bacterium]